jgi:hypothetical protein
MIWSTRVSTLDSFSAGETVITRETFSPDALAFWLKTELAVTEKRIAGRAPNTFGRFFPVGSREVLFPLKQVSAISVETKIRPIRMLFGAVLILAALFSFSSSVLAALALLVVGVLLVESGLRAILVVISNAGVRDGVEVSLFEKAKLESFAAQAKRHLIDL